MSKTSGMHVAQAIGRGVSGLADTLGKLSKDLHFNPSLSASLESVKESMTSAMDYAIDKKRMLFRSTEMVTAMDELLNYVRGAVNHELVERSRDGSRPTGLTGAIDMKQLNKEIEGLIQGVLSDSNAPMFFYGDGEWIMDGNFAGGLTEKLNAALGVKLDQHAVNMHFSKIINCALNSMETAEIDGKDKVRLFFKKGYESAKADLTHKMAVLKAHASYGATYAAEKAKVGGAYALKAGTALNQYLLQPAWRTLINIFSTACLAVATAVAIPVAIASAAVEVGGVGSRVEGKTFERTEKIVGGLAELWAKRLAQIKGHVQTLNDGRQTAIGAANGRIKAVKDAASSRLVSGEHSAVVIRDSAIKDAKGNLTKSREATRKGMEQETEALAKAKAQKKQEQRVITAAREIMRSVDTKWGKDTDAKMQESRINKTLTSAFDSRTDRAPLDGSGTSSPAEKRPSTGTTFRRRSSGPAV